MGPAADPLDPGGSEADRAEVEVALLALRAAQRLAQRQRDQSRALLAALGEGYALTVDGVIRDVNDAFVELTGFDRSALIGLAPPFPFWAPDDGSAAAEQAHRVITAGGGEIECVWTRRDGSRFIAALTARPVDLAGWSDDLDDADSAEEPAGDSRPAEGALTPKRVFVNVVRNVSVAREREAEVEQSRVLLDEAQQLAQVGSWTWDLTTGQVTCTATMRLVSGLAPDGPAPTPHDFGARVHPEDREGYLQVFAAGLQAGHRHTIAHRVIRPDGSVHHVEGTAIVERDPSGAPLRVRGTSQDVTDRVRREEALADSEQRFRFALSLSPVGLIFSDPVTGEIVEVNAGLARMLGEAPEHLIGQAMASLSHPDDRDLDADDLADLLAGRSAGYEVERRLRGGDGGDVWVAAHASLLRDVAGRPLQLVTQLVDLTAQRARTDALDRVARTDPLTGLANRRGWEPVLAAQLAAATEGNPLCVAIIDLDHFKLYNDTRGHGAGDQVLVGTAAAWQVHLASAVPDALIARLGGEEFGLTLPGTDITTACSILDKIRLEVSDGQTASAGVTQATADDDPSSIMRRADIALYAAKRRGRNQVHVGG